MGAHPLNLAIRFLLELIALLAMGVWGWDYGGQFKYVLALVIPVFAAACWGVFAVPNDPSRSGSAPIPISGCIRLLLEFLFFGLACWMIYDLNYSSYAGLFLAVTALHYLFSFDRIRWLLDR
ncbi:MAG: YrdB family protein [Reichenbachiella sp.]|uniref:YrdB family protein n=1 Tax=Reichenbachiella sp. TaxID=2184521 RepID=UPI00326748CE